MRRCIGYALIVAIALVAVASLPAPPDAHAGAAEAINVHGFFSAMIRQDGDDGLAQNYAYMGTPFDNFQLFVNTDAVLSDRVAIFTRVRFDDAAGASIGLDGAYVQFQNFTRADVYVQLGKVPSPFGTFQERSYPDRNPLIGLPLMYFHHTTLRSDMIPEGPADLWAVKGMDQYGFSYPSATTPSYRTGMPTIYDPCWDYGLIVLGTWGRLEGRLGIMNGAPGYPETGKEWNPSRSPSARLGWVPVPSMRVGVSATRGPYLTSTLESQLPAGHKLSEYTQTVLGADAEFTHGWWELRGEWIVNRFKNPGIEGDLEHYSYYVEGRRKLSAGLYAAGRWDEFIYGKTEDPSGGQGRWGDHVARAEFALGYWAESNLLFKADLQMTRTGDGGFESNNRIAGIQAVLRY